MCGDDKDGVGASRLAADRATRASPQAPAGLGHSASIADAEDIVALILDAADASPWDATEQGLWCPHCGDIIAPDFFFERDADYRPPENCRQCGYPEFGA